MEREIDRATQAGLHVLPVLAYPPRTESVAGCKPLHDPTLYAPRDLTGWTYFVTAVVRHFP